MVGRKCTVLLSVTSGSSSGRQGQGLGVLGLRGISVMTKQRILSNARFSVELSKDVSFATVGRWERSYLDSQSHFF